MFEMFEMYLIDRLPVFYNISIVLSGLLALFGTILWLICVAYLVGLVGIKLPKKVKNNFYINWIYIWNHYKFLRILSYIIIIAIAYLLLSPSKELFYIFIENLSDR